MIRRPPRSTRLTHSFPTRRSSDLPRKDDDSVTVLALLDSASTAGAYRFVIYPGRTTVIDVDTAIFTRTRLDGAGIAPITSLYLHGATDYRRRDALRPAVHEFDGVSMVSGEGGGM